MGCGKRVWQMGTLGLLLSIFSSIGGHGGAQRNRFEVRRLLFPPLSRQSQLCEAFIADFEARANGQVKVRYFPGGSLLKPNAVVRGG